MKQYSTLFALFFFVSLSAQDIEKTNGIFYKISLAATVTNNEDFTFGNDNGETFLRPNGLFINNTFGYQLDERTSVGFNVEYNHYLDQNLNFLPVFFDLTYNILDFDDVVFVRVGYGKLVDLGNDFEDGNTYKIGLGYRIFDDDFRNSWLIGFDFSRKRFGFRQAEKLSSFSIFLEFMVF